MSEPAAAASATGDGSAIAGYFELTKPRLTSLVLATSGVGYLVGSPQRIDVLPGALMLAGMIAVVGGGNALNQYLERDIDARMRRTQGRPLPTGRLSPAQALAFGTAISLAGLALLLLLVDPLAAAIALVGWVAYVFVYTPFKMRTAASTLIGAVPGAVPPLVGWAAARGSLEPAAWSLFAIVFVWQIPHFFAISRHFRDDYERGGFPMLGVHDPDGRATGRLTAAYALLLIPIAALPAVLGIAGNSYLIAGLALGFGFFGVAVWSLRTIGAGHERWVFLASLVYLTGLMAMLVVDRVPAA